MNLGCLLFSLLLTQVAAVHFIRAADPSLYHSKWNWYANPTSGSIEAANPGPCVKFTVIGTTKLNLILDKPLRTDYFANVAWSINSGPLSYYSLGVDTRINMTDKLKATEQYTVFLYIPSGNGWVDRWVGPSTNVRIMGFEADDGSTFSSPALAPKTMLIYGDSIAQGANTADTNNPDWIKRDDALLTFSYAVAEAVDAEISLMAWGGQGLSVGGTGNIPPLWSASGSSNTSAWIWHNDHTKRSFDVCPDYVLNGHGTNDGLGHRPVAEVAPRVTGWLTSMRATCPKAKIFQVIPFGQFSSKAIAVGFRQYQDKAKDAQAHLIDLGDKAKSGLDHIAPSWCSVDGIHPWGWRSSQLGAQLAVAIAQFI